MYGIVAFICLCRPSRSDEQLHQSAHRVHPIEDAKRLAQVDQNKPGGEAEKLFPEAVLELRMDSERRDDPQLQEEGTWSHCVTAETAEGRSLKMYDITITFDRMRNAQISCIALLVHGCFPSCS